MAAHSQLVFRPMESGDATMLYQMVNENRDRMKVYFPVTLSETSSLDLALKYVAEKIEAAKKREFFPFVIHDPNADKIAGYLLIKDLNWRVPKGELAYCIAKDYEGKGIMSWAVGLLVDYSFARLEMKKVYLLAADINHGSCRVAEKNGFVREGLLRQDYRGGDGKLVDSRFYGLLREEFYG